MLAGIGDLDRALDAIPASSGLHWVGLFLVAVAGLFVWTTWRRLGESENPPIDVAALVWAALGGDGRAARWRSIVQEAAGRPPAGWRWRRTASASTRSAAGRRASSTSPCWRRLLSLATLGLWWFDSGLASTGFGLAGDHLFGGLYAAGAFALMWNAARPGFWAALSVAAALAHFLFCW